VHRGVGELDRPADDLAEQGGSPRRNTRAVRARLRVSLTIPPHKRRPSQKRSYDALVRKTSSRPSATPTRLCTVEAMATGCTNVWKQTTPADQMTHVITRTMISRSIEPRMSNRCAFQSWAS
jgi:hypothetical protein